MGIKKEEEKLAQTKVLLLFKKWVSSWHAMRDSGKNVFKKSKFLDEKQL